MSVSRSVSGKGFRWFCLFAAWIGCAAVSACATNSDGEGFASDPGAGGGSAGPGGVEGSGGSSGMPSAPPPEREAEAQYLAPVVSGKILWSVNPLSGRVAIIDAETFEVVLDSAGDGPSQVLGLPERAGRSSALILNERSDDATLINVAADGSRQKLAPFRVPPAANAWAKSPSAEYAIAYTQLREPANVSALETFQEIALFTLRPDEERVYPLSVGPRPRAFVFNRMETHAYAVTEAGISVVELGVPPLVTDLLQLSDDPFQDPAELDVSFSADGSRAIIRREGATRFSVVALPSGERREVELGERITDLDLTQDGELAFAVLGAAKAIVTVPLSRDLSADEFSRTELQGELFGAIRLNSDETAAVVYSTVLDSTRATIFDVSDTGELSEPRSFDLISRVNALLASPDPRFAVSLQLAAAGSARRGAFSLLSLKAERTPKVVATAGQPLDVAFDEAGTSALLRVGGGPDLYGAYLIGLESQRVDWLPLASPPLSIGIVPTVGRGYVAQQHPEGRITFLDLDGSDVRTLTGFELAARIRD